MRRRLMVFCALCACLGAVAALAGCPLTSEVYINNFPLDGEIVSRNAAVWVDLNPHSARVTEFALYQLSGGQSILVPVRSYRDPDTNEYLFCPVNNLDPFSDYEVYLEVNGTEIFTWSFRTDASFDGSPDVCYYITPWGTGCETDIAMRFWLWGAASAERQQ